MMANAEFGIAMAQICINENQTARAEVAQYPDEGKHIVARCSRRKGMSWAAVKKCINGDIAAAPVLDAHARGHESMLQRCQEEFRGRETSTIRLCVDKAIEAEKSRGDK